MIYKLILSIRDAWYRSGRHSTEAEVPTICVGNIAVGGTGKTPHIEMLLRDLQDSGRWASRSLAVLSRGYGRRSRGFRMVDAGGSAADFGDEPLQIKRKFPHVAVAVDKDRVEGCRKLVHPDSSREAADIILLDDAWQYRKLRPSLGIVLTDYNRPSTEDSLLPAGRLRDLKRRLFDADILIVTKCPYALDAEEKAAYAERLGWERRKKDGAMLLFSQLEYDKPEPVFSGTDSRYVYSGKAVLFTGIANDTPLVQHVSDNYRIVEHLHYPDHHRYTRADIRALKAALKRNPTAIFITTEKDAQRLRDLPDFPEQLRERLFCVPVRVGFCSPEERAALLEKLTSL